MKKKKFLAIILTAVLVIGLLSGCGGSKESTASKSVSVKEVTEESSDASKNAEKESEQKSEAKTEEASSASSAPSEDTAAVSEPSDAEDDVTAESLLKGYYDIAEDVQAIAFDLLLDMDMKIEAMGEENATRMKMDVHYETDGENAYMTGSMESDANGEQEKDDVEQYVIKEGDQLITYSYDKETDSWSNNGSTEIFSISRELIPRPDPSRFTLEETGDYYKVFGELEISEVLKNSGEAMNQLFEGLVGAAGDNLSGLVKLEYHFDKETRALKEVHLDLAAVIEETFKALLGSLFAMGESEETSTESIDVSSMFNVEMNAFAFTISNIDMDESLKIVLPDEVKEAADSEKQEKEDTSSDSKTSGSSDGSASAFESFSPIDNEECTVTVKEFATENDYEYAIKLALANNSSDKKYSFMSQSAYVNGVKADGYLYEDVAAGKKSNAQISLYKSELEEYGIDDITDIEIKLEVRDADDWSADPAAEETFHIYPKGSENAEVFEREPQKTDNVLVDNDDLSVIITETGTDEWNDYAVQLYLVNKSDSVLYYTAEDVSMNGFMTEPYFSTTVDPGKIAFGKMNWSSSTLEENEIKEVEEIEFTLHVSDYEDWSKEVFKETFTIKP